MSTEDASNKTEETATVAEPPTVLPYDPTPTDTGAERDTAALIAAEDADISTDEDSEEEERRPRRRKTVRFQAKWWFQEAEVKRNWYVVVGAWFLLVLGVVCIPTGIVFEIVRHTSNFELFRGFVFFFIAIVLLIPSVYAVLHVYLAAKRVGRVRFSSVWFFR